MYNSDILADEGRGSPGGQSELLLSVFTLAVFPSSSFVIQEALRGEGDREAPQMERRTRSWDAGLYEKVCY